MFQSIVEREHFALNERTTTVSTPSRNNLSKSKQQALYNLKCHDDIVIWEADQGRAVVVLTTSDYRTEAVYQLNDASTYLILKVGPISAFKQQLSHLLDMGKEIGVSAPRVADHWWNTRLFWCSTISQKYIKVRPP